MTDTKRVMKERKTKFINFINFEWGTNIINFINFVPQTKFINFINFARGI